MSRPFEELVSKIMESRPVQHLMLLMLDGTAVKVQGYMQASCGTVHLHLSCPVLQRCSDLMMGTFVASLNGEICFICELEEVRERPYWPGPEDLVDPEPSSAYQQYLLSNSTLPWDAWCELVRS